MSNSEPNNGEQSIQYEASKVSWATSQFIRRPPALSVRIFIYSIALTLLSATAYSIVAESPVLIHTQGSLAPEQGIISISASENLQVTSLLVRPNQEVKKDQKLVSTREEMTADTLLRIKNHLEEYQAFVTREKSKQCSDCAKELRAISQKGPFSSLLGPAREVLLPLHEVSLSFAVALSQVQEISKTTISYRRQIHLAEGKLKEIKRRGAERLLSAQIEQLTNDIVNARNAIAEKESAVTQAIEESRNRFELALSEVGSRIETHQERYSITSPITGTLSSLFVKSGGQTLTVGTEIARVIPADSLLVAEIEVPNKDISKVHTGQAVVIKLDAFPEREYGVMNGTIAFVPISVSTTTNSTSSSYQVKARLNQQSLQANGKSYALKIGMTLKGQIIVRKEKLIKRAARRLLKIKDELAGDN